MIAFQNIKSGEFLSHVDGFVTMPLLCDAYPFHETDEVRLRKEKPFLADYRTVTFSARPGHPLNNLADPARKQWTRGYFCAVALFIRENYAVGFCDTPAKSLFKMGGDWRNADPEDIEIFRLHGLLPKS